MYLDVLMDVYNETPIIDWSEDKNYTQLHARNKQKAHDYTIVISDFFISRTEKKQTRRTKQDNLIALSVESERHVRLFRFDFTFGVLGTKNTFAHLFENFSSTDAQQRNGSTKAWSSPHPLFIYFLFFVCLKPVERRNPVQKNGLKWNIDSPWKLQPTGLVSPKKNVQDKTFTYMIYSWIIPPISSSSLLRRWMTCGV